MKEKTQLSTNIKALRIAYGETQEDLSNAVYVKSTAISNYESGVRVPDNETLELIANHYSVSVEELLYCDYSNLGPISIDPEYFNKNIGVIFPIVSSDEALLNGHFQRAYKSHKEMYENLKINNLAIIDGFDRCFEEYMNSYNDERSKLESAANLLALEYSFINYIKLMSKTPEIVNNTPAWMMQVASKNNRVRRDLLSIDLANDAHDMAESANEVLDFYKDPETVEVFNSFKTDLKNSSMYSDIAYYYLALQYLLGLVDNGLRDEYNQRIGMEMMHSLTSVDNPFATSLIRFFDKAYNSTSRSVDDK